MSVSRINIVRRGLAQVQIRRCNKLYALRDAIFHAIFSVVYHSCVFVFAVGWISSNAVCHFHKTHL